jgi:hypothetical protein
MMFYEKNTSNSANWPKSQILIVKWILDDYLVIIHMEESLVPSLSNFEKIKPRFVTGQQFTDMKHNREKHG